MDQLFIVLLLVKYYKYLIWHIDPAIVESWHGDGRDGKDVIDGSCAVQKTDDRTYSNSLTHRHTLHKQNTENNSKPREKCENDASPWFLSTVSIQKGGPDIKWLICKCKGETRSFFLLQILFSENILISEILNIWNISFP